jgi:hypothetical protein
VRYNAAPSDLKLLVEMFFDALHILGNTMEDEVFTTSAGVE